MSLCNRVLPYIKPNFVDGCLGQDGGPIDGVPPTQFAVATELSPGLSVVYLYQEPTNEKLFLYLKYQDLLDEKMSKMELHELAIRNLRRMISNLTIQQYDDLFYVIFLDSNFGASVILLDELWDEKFVDKAPNEYIVSVPSREFVGFCDARSTNGIQRLREFAAAVITNDCTHSITTTLYIRDTSSRSWRPYVN